MKNSVNMSIPKSRKVRGYEIKHMPIGQSLVAIQMLGELPGALIIALFPDADNALEQLKSLTKDGLQSLALYGRSW